MAAFAPILKALYEIRESDLMEERRETCQRGCLDLQVDSKGRVRRHDDFLAQAGTCPRSYHPSLEEMARRREKRRAKRAEELTAALVDAPVVLDAWIEGRTEMSERIPDLCRVALHELSRRRRSRLYGTWLVREGVTQCWFCDAKFNHDRRASVLRSHRIQCSLLFLSGRLDHLHPPRPPESKIR